MTIWKWELDDHQFDVTDRRVDLLQQRTNELLKLVNGLQSNIATLMSNDHLMVSTMNQQSIYLKLYKLHFEGAIDHDEVKRLISMLDSPDKEDKNLAEELIDKHIKGETDGK